MWGREAYLARVRRKHKIRIENKKHADLKGEGWNDSEISAINKWKMPSHCLMKVMEAQWKVILGERFSSTTCKCGQIGVSVSHILICSHDETKKLREKAGIEFDEGRLINDTPRRHAVSNVNKCLSILSALGHKEGEKYMDYIKIAENEEDAEKTTNKLLDAKDKVTDAADAYWDEMAEEHEYEESEREKYRIKAMQNGEMYQKFMDSQD